MQLEKIFTFLDLVGIGSFGLTAERLGMGPLLRFMRFARRRGFAKFPDVLSVVQGW